MLAQTLISLFFSETSEDCKLYATKLVQSIKAFSYNIYFTALDDSHTKERKKCICDEFFKKIEKAVGQEPHRFTIEYVLHEVVVLKEDIVEKAEL